MADFNIFFPILMEQEGYYANDPQDSGGETWRGISRKNYPRWEGWPIVDNYKESPVFPKNMRSDKGLEEMVKKFYKVSQWDTLRGDEIANQSIANFIADWAVNAGRSVPVKHAQEILGVQQYGILGQQTLAAINSTDGPDFFKKLKAAREQFYFDVVAAHPQNKKFLSNWLERNASFEYTA